MSSTNSVQLTEEQKKFLNSLEEEFKDRYTDNDDEFKAVLSERLPLPPIVENWGESGNRDERHDNYRYRHNRYHDYDDRHRNTRRYEPYYRDRDGDGSYSSYSSRRDYSRHGWIRDERDYSDSYRS